MADADIRDAHTGVVLELANGRWVTGRPVPYRDALDLIIQIEDSQMGADPRATLVQVLARFQEITGIDEAAFEGLSLGEVIDTMNRFFYHKRSARTATKPLPAPPAATGTPPA